MLSRPIPLYRCPHCHRSTLAFCFSNLLYPICSPRLATAREIAKQHPDDRGYGRSGEGTGNVSSNKGACIFLLTMGVLHIIFNHMVN